MTLASCRSTGRDRKKWILLIAALLFCGVVCLTVAGATPLPKAVFQGLFVLCFLAAIFFWVQNLLTSYTLLLQKEEDGVWLLIVRTQGKKQLTLARVKAGEITAVRSVRRGEKPARKETRRDFVFTTAPFSSATLLFTDVGSGPISFRVEATPEFLTALEEARSGGTFYDPGRPEQGPDDSEED